MCCGDRNPRSLNASARSYVTVAFFRGTSQTPLPPGESKGAETRYVDIREHDGLDEAQLRRWVEQAAALPGWKGK